MNIKSKASKLWLRSFIWCSKETISDFWFARSNHKMDQNLTIRFHLQLSHTPFLRIQQAIAACHCFCSQRIEAMIIPSCYAPTCSSVVVLQNYPWCRTAIAGLEGSINITFYPLRLWWLPALLPTHWVSGVLNWVGQLPEIKGCVYCPSSCYPNRYPDFSMSPLVPRHPDRPHATQNNSCIFSCNQTWINKALCPCKGVQRRHLYTSKHFHLLPKSPGHRTF
jgi:hypothetical protein